jgi:hypothetical protein
MSSLRAGGDDGERASEEAQARRGPAPSSAPPATAVVLRNSRRVDIRCGSRVR